VKLSIVTVPDVKIIVLGCGNIGSVAAKDLAESMPLAEIALADMNASRARDAASKIDRENVSWVQTDASNHRELVKTLKKFELGVGALPGMIGYQVCKASIEAGLNMVDVSYMPEDIMTLNEDASKAEITLLPDCGMSPGLGNILIGHATSKLDQVKSVHIVNGGLPEKPLPPLGYVITWSVRDLIDMYSRKVNVVKEGKRVQAEAMSGLEETDFPGVGKLEAFYTDGLRTLLYTMKGVKDMWEKSLRYPGHVEKIKLLKTLGLFDEKPVEVENRNVSPRELTARLLESKLKRTDVPDIVAMHVEVSGTKNGKPVTYTYNMLDRYDKEHHVTAMARTTAYTTSAVAQLLAKKAVAEKGVVPPEKLGMNRRLYDKFMDMMEKRKVTIKESRETA
jgi:saccharopine dehydrogenase-like NADP-dependent oxidoreductase